MFSWGEHSGTGFRLQDSHVVHTAAEAEVHSLNLGYHVSDLSAGRGVLAFVKTNGNAFIIRTNEGKDGKRVRGKQKCVKCKEHIEAVSCCDDVVVLLSKGGSVYCVDTTVPPFTPRKPDVLNNIPVSQVACGSGHSLVLTKDGQVYTWGQDSRGQLGLGKRKPGANSPQQLKSLSAMPLVRVAAGGEQSFALSVSGGVFGWGRNDRGQLGLGDTADRHKPTAVKCLNMKKSVQICCGKDHTATVTKDGAVFTFGSGQYGQLGHNSLRDELRPRLVAELLGAKVTKIACGMHHTLVLTDSDKVYSFGCGEQGQLGRGGTEGHPSVPLPVQLPQGSCDGPNIRNIYAGGNCSFATCTSDEESNTDAVGNVSLFCLEDVIDKWTSTCDPKSWKKVKLEIHRAFSSAACANQSFLEKSKDKHFQTSTKYHGLNLSLARHTFRKLVKTENVLAEVEAAVLHLLLSSHEPPVGVEGLRIFLLLSELLFRIQKHKGRQSTKLTEAVAAAVLGLPAESLQVIGNWWNSLSASTMSKYVMVWKKALSVILSSKPVPRNSGVQNLLLVLQCMYNANSRTAESHRIPSSDFCLVVDVNFLREDLEHWLIQSMYKNANAKPLILCSFPFMMDLQSKKQVFDMYTNTTKKMTMGDFWWNMFIECGPENLPPDLFFNLNLRRDTILEDTFEELSAAPHSDYRKWLAVHFDGNSAHSNVYKKDFFYDVFHEMVSAESEMFIFNDAKTLAWFPSRPTQDHHRYFLFGVLCGLALYNRCIIYLPFPMALFKKLLGVKPSMEDMMEFCPFVGKSLLSILEEYADLDFTSLEMDFLITWDGTDVDLDPGNPEKPVTSQTKKEFVDAYVNHAFNTSVKSVFTEFKQGFFEVCGQEMVKLFQPKELQEVLVGRDFHAWERLKQDTIYEGEYHVSHPTIQMFWDVFEELTEDQKISFLWFVTGFDRVPIHGMAKIQMKIRVKQEWNLPYDQDKNLPDDQYYPESYTCHTMLDLPLYSTREIMQTKLIEALSNKRKNYK
ncbi:putative E3 ubiquitin-protein ligase HERC4 [Solea senegalensis]|uniref:E3 ubiquitin-protein ligase HERC4 n=1 Tax=Solea senegalensis TaxID=28829 RepID=A0AAV6T1G2_SOLSE|nr:probable E3 ubiquitin-protein ligase HERC3 isoform X2 [Solea senegalensis]KAG7523241.1 putative E3 ubiquitin-protein ligase HERC4 [Solea senegalensis]